MNVSRICFLGAATIVLLAICVAPALAQRGKWWQDKQFQGELTLTPKQISRLEEVFQKTQPTLRQRMRDLDKAEDEFDRLVESGDDASLGPGVRRDREGGQGRAEQNAHRDVASHAAEPDHLSVGQVHGSCRRA